MGFRQAGLINTFHRMKFFENVLAEKTRIEKAIKKYGNAPEHNFWWYYCQEGEGQKDVYIEFSDGAGLLTYEEREQKRVTVFASPVAPPERRVPIIIEYLERVFQSSRIEKVIFELETELRRELLKKLPAHMKARAINYTLVWPVYNFENFDSKMSGKHWKTLRKERNTFYQNHRVSVVKAEKYKDKEALHQIIEEWRKKRGGRDRAYFFPYYNFIDGNFRGATEARVLVVDGKAVGINSGWMIPNTNRFYGALGIHNYSLPDLGDMLYLEDLMWLKKHNYKEADMGGGEAALTNFKNKFQPQSFYKTHNFSVVKC